MYYLLPEPVVISVAVKGPPAGEVLEIVQVTASPSVTPRVWMREEDVCVS